MNGKLIKIENLNHHRKGYFEYNTHPFPRQFNNIHSYNTQLLGFKSKPSNSDKVNYAYLTSHFINIRVNICQNLSLFSVYISQ